MLYIFSPLNVLKSFLVGFAINMDDDFDFQYSTIAEVKAEMSTKPQQSQDHTKTADSSDQSAKDSNKVSPPHSPLELNSQNPVTSSLLMNGHKTGELYVQTL